MFGRLYAGILFELAPVIFPRLVLVVLAPHVVGSL